MTVSYCAGWIQAPLQQLKPGEGSHAGGGQEGCRSRDRNWLGDHREADWKTGGAGAEVEKRKPADGSGGRSRSGMLGSREQTGAPFLLPGDLWNTKGPIRPPVSREVWRRRWVRDRVLGGPCFPHRARMRGAQEGSLCRRQLEKPETLWSS